MSDYSDESDEQERIAVKRLDKLRYYGGLGKRNTFTGRVGTNGKFLKKSKSDIDRLRFMGNLGK